MAENVIAANISINGSRSDGDISSGGEEQISVLKDIRDILKEQKNLTAKRSKLERAGFLGGKGGIGGALQGVIGGATVEIITLLAAAGLLTPALLSALLTGTAAATTMASGMESQTQEEIQSSLNNIKNELGIQGEDNSQITEKIRGILSSLGLEKAGIDKLLAPFTSWLDNALDAVDITKKINSKQNEELNIQDQINQAQLARLEALKNFSFGGYQSGDIFTGNTPDLSGRFRETGSGYADLARNQSVTREEAMRRAMYDQATYQEVLKGEQVLTGIIKENNLGNPPTNVGFVDLNQIFNFEGR